MPTPSGTDENAPSATVASGLPPEALRRYDETPDTEFYTIPRLVTHIDDAAIAAVTALYREQFKPGDDLLDLMSSWVSHLPPDVEYKRVAGLGLNARELAANPRLTDWTVQSLNDNPHLPYEDSTFDGCGICVSIQYLTDPVAILTDLGRVLRPDSPLVITFSNRCFPTKAVAIWQRLSDADHLRLIAHYLEAAEVWDAIELRDASPSPNSDPLFAVIARRKR